MAKRKTSEKKPAPQGGAEKSKPSQESIPAKPEQKAAPAVEKPAAKPEPKSTISQESTPRKSERGGISDQERHHLISQTAYYIAERRGFIPGGELEDWLEAEAEVDRRLEMPS